MNPERLPDEVFQRHLRIEANRALERGALVAGALAVVATLSIPLAMLSGLGRDLELPVAFAFCALASCVVLYTFARRGRVTGATAYLVMLPFVSLPTAFYLACHALAPAGAATFLNGPLTLLYGVLIAVTGCLFDARLAFSAGATCALGYSLCAALALPELERIAHPDPNLRQDLVAPVIYAFRALMLVFCGAAVGALAVVAKRLVSRVLREEQDKATISRLFGEYVSEEVKEKLLREPLQPEGELKEVFILFSDLRGFTRASEGMAPTDLVRRLNEYFDAMVARIRGEGGVVDKFVGDAIMAVFGGVIELPDPCAAAVRAARGMEDALALLNATWATEGLPPFAAGIGIHVGEVVQGNIGSAQRKDFTVIGDAVNTASRVEGLTKDQPYPILITGAVWARLPAELQAECPSLGEVPVKGRAAAVPIHGVPGAGPAEA